jgi:hypothetical protein
MTSPVAVAGAEPKMPVHRSFMGFRQSRALLCFVAIEGIREMIVDQEQSSQRLVWSILSTILFVCLFCWLLLGTPVSCTSGGIGSNIEVPEGTQGYVPPEELSLHRAKRAAECAYVEGRK